MMGGKLPPGYTIVETLIFLAVSGMLFVSAMILIGGQQRKAEFAQAVKDFESQMQDLANNVSTGYYVNPGNLSCNGTNTSPAADIVPLLASAEQGTNNGCIILGQVVQFAPDGKKQTYKIIPVAGKQRINAPPLRDVLTLSEARPMALAQGNTFNSAGPDISQTVNFGNTVSIESFKYGSGTSAAAIGFFSKFGQDATGNLSGSQAVDLYAIGTIFGDVSKNVVDIIHNYGSWSGTLNPLEGYTICLASLVTDQHADVTIGGNGRKYSIFTLIKNGACG